jgi:hypothetical protein
MSATKFTAAMAILLCTAACGDTWGQRAVTGAQSARVPEP